MKSRIREIDHGSWLSRCSVMPEYKTVPHKRITQPQVLACHWMVLYKLCYQNTLQRMGNRYIIEREINAWHGERIEQLSLQVLSEYAGKYSMRTIGVVVPKSSMSHTRLTRQRRLENEYWKSLNKVHRACNCASLDDWVCRSPLLGCSFPILTTRCHKSMSSKVYNNMDLAYHTLGLDVMGPCVIRTAIYESSPLVVCW